MPHEIIIINGEVFIGTRTEINEALAEHRRWLADRGRVSKTGEEGRKILHLLPPLSEKLSVAKPWA